MNKNEISIKIKKDFSEIINNVHNLFYKTRYKQLKFSDIYDKKNNLNELSEQQLSDILVYVFYTYITYFTKNHPMSVYLKNYKFYEHYITKPTKNCVFDHIIELASGEKIISHAYETTDENNKIVYKSNFFNINDFKTKTCFVVIGDSPVLLWEAVNYFHDKIINTTTNKVLHIPFSFRGFKENNSKDELNKKYEIVSKYFEMIFGNNNVDKSYRVVICDMVYSGKTLDMLNKCLVNIGYDVDNIYQLIVGMEFEMYSEFNMARCQQPFDFYDIEECIENKKMCVKKYNYMRCNVIMTLFNYYLANYDAINKLNNKIVKNYENLYKIQRKNS